MFLLRNDYGTLFTGFIRAAVQCYSTPSRVSIQTSIRMCLLLLAITRAIPVPSLRHLFVDVIFFLGPLGSLSMVDVRQTSANVSR